MEEERVDLRRYLDILARWWWLLLLGPIVAGSAAYIFSAQQVPQYRSSTLVLVQQSSGLPLSSLGDVQLSQVLASTYKEVITTRPILEAVVAELDLPFATSTLRSKTSVSVVPSTSLLRIEATDDGQERAAAISNTVAQQFIRLTQQNQLGEIARVQSALAAQGISDPQ
ncbi:MAG: hypothetical protein HYX93_01695, partial [Chloroflexi bacterium]|nr:hypothetical protein [Chloroflexota bacterium]